MFATPLIASESFGGIGVSVCQVHEGAYVAEVIPGTPAAESKLQVGDVIIAIDGESLKGYSIGESKAKLRGEVNKPLEITYINGVDTLSATLRRVQITVKDLERESVESWYGGKSVNDLQELETFASSTENDKQLVAVLQNGSLVQSDAYIELNSLNGVYVERVNEFSPKVNPLNKDKSASAVLKEIGRTAIGFELKSAGRAVISIINADGTVVAKLLSENAHSGYNSLKWSSENVPSGRYMVTIEHNGSVSGKYALLK